MQLGLGEVYGESTMIDNLYDLKGEFIGNKDEEYSRLEHNSISSITNHAVVAIKSVLNQMRSGP